MGRNELIFVVAVITSAALLSTSVHAFWIGLVAAATAFSCVWIASLALRNAGIVDIFWGPGLVLLAWLYYLVAEDGAHRFLEPGGVLFMEIGHDQREPVAAMAAAQPAYGPVSFTRDLQGHDRVARIERRGAL